MLSKMFITILLISSYVYLFGIKSVSKYQEGGVVIQRHFLEDTASELRPGLYNITFVQTVRPDS